MQLNRLTELLEMFNEKAPIARYFGMKLSYNSKGQAIITLPYNPNLDHALGGIHGGVYMTMLDNAGWFTSAAAHDIPCWVATSEISIHLLEPVKECGLRAEGMLIKTGKRLDVAEMKLFDDDWRLVGHATGSFVVLPKVRTDEI